MSTKRFLQKFTILVVFLLIAMFALPKAVIAQNNQVEENEIKSVIQQYFELRYIAGKLLVTVDFSAMVIPPTSDSRTANWLREEEDKEEIEQAIARLYNSGYLQYSYFLDYESINIKDAEANVLLMESNEVVYTNHPEYPSKMGYVEHQILFQKIDTKWKIVIDIYQDDIKKLMAISTKDDILKNIQANFDAQFTQPGTTISQNGQINNPLYTFYNIDHNAIKNYADSNWNKTTNNALSSALKNSYPGWNPSWYNYWLFHSSNDCANFASQAIFTGTSYNHSDPNTFTPNTSDQSKWWYHFSPTVQDSAGWSSVSGLHTFLINNLNRGPIGHEGGTDFCSLTPGDLVMMQSGSTWVHTVVVSAIVGDCHSTANILVDAHTNPYYQKPLSFWSGYTLHAVSLLGYRK